MKLWLKLRVPKLFIFYKKQISLWYFERERILREVFNKNRIKGWRRQSLSRVWRLTTIVLIEYINHPEKKSFLLWINYKRKISSPHATLEREGAEEKGEGWRATVYMNKVTAEVKEGKSERIKGWRRGNILDGSIVMLWPPQSILQERWTARAESEVRWRRFWAWHLQWNEERILRLPPASFSCPVSSSLSPLVPRRWFLFPRDARRLTRLSSKFTLYRRSTKPRPLRGFIKNWGCNLPRGSAGGTV